jgi:branched-chain amino acid transport system ATP-binding protein
MSFVMGACDHIHVLDFGRLIAEGSPTEIQANPDVRAAYLGSKDHGTKADAAAKAAGAEPDLPIVVEVASDKEKVATPAPVSGDALALRDLRAAYGIIDVLHDVDLTLPQGTVFALLGPNGARKSTTLKVCSGLLKPPGGSVHVLGEDVTGKSADAMARSGVCLVPEGRGIFPNLTVTENLRMATYSGTPFKTVVERAFERFPRLKERRKQVAGTLSGGEQQMLSMARALAIDPKVLLLDELSMGLAPLIVEELYEVEKRIAEDHESIPLVEQFAHEVLGAAATAAITLHGRVAYDGKPTEVGEALDRAYLGGSVAG